MIYYIQLVNAVTHKGVNELLDNIIGVAEAKEITGLAEGTIKNYCAEGKFPAKKIGKTWILDKIKLKETVNMNKIKQAIEYGLNEDLIKVLTEEETIDAAIEELAEMYEGSELTVEQFVFEKAEEVGIVRDAEEYDDNDEANADGYYWFDEVSKWIMLD